MEGSGRVSPTKLPTRCPALILKQNRLSTPPRRSFFALNPLSNCLIRSFIFARTCAKQRTFPKPFHSRPNCCIFLQQTAPFSPIGERTFLSFARLNPMPGPQKPAIAAGSSRRMPGRADDCEPDAPPQSAVLPPPLDRETPAPGISPSVWTLKTTPPAFPAWKKAPGPSRRPLSGFEFIPRR